MSFAKISRRHLLIGAGSTAVVAGTGGLWFGVWKAGQRRWAKPVKRAQAFAPSVYLAVGSDDETTIWLMRTEMGQGVMTALPTLIAEELDADWSKVAVKLADVDTNFDFGGMYTAASGSIISMWMELRQAGAAAREMLVAEAASRWGVDEDECRTERGIVSHPRSGDTFTYGELAVGAARRRAPLRPQLKASKDFSIIGKRTSRVDVPEKINGRAKFGIDIRLDNALWVSMVRCPIQGGTFKSVDEKPALLVEGVEQVIPIEAGVAVAANSTWAAQNGLQALRPQWNLPTPRSTDNDIDKKLTAQLEKQGVVAHSSGKDSWNAKDTIHLMKATYEVPFLTHAPMEPPNCSIQIEGGRCEVWVPTQNPDTVHELAVSITSLSPSNVVVHRTFVGGGFGRRTNPDEVEEALKIAVLLKRPVHFIWSREDDIRQGYFREAASHRIEGNIAADGTRLNCSHRLVSASNRPADDPSGELDEITLMGAVDSPYSMEDFRVEWAWLPSPVRIGIWRSVGYSHNTFVLESFLDELAFSRRQDPYELRRNLLPPDSRLIACLEKVKEMAKWPGSSKDDSAMGIAICACFGSYIAQIAEVERAANGKPRVLNIWCALDCGIMVNPDIIEAQIEGGIVFGLTAALHGRIDVRDGAVAQSNFHDYPLLRQSEVPEIHISLISSTESPAGMGEIPVPPVAPAVFNAWFRLTGERKRALPFS